MLFWFQVLAIAFCVIGIPLIYQIQIARRRGGSSLDQAVEAVKIDKLKLCDNFGASSDKDEFVPQARVKNPYISILYWRTLREDGHLVETIDFLLGGGGGLCVTFDNNRVIRWSHPMSPFSHTEMEPDRCLLALHVLQEVRRAAGVKG